MGYSTDFEGQFDCYRVESPIHGEFLKAIYGGDRAAMGMFADWLMEQDDLRGEQVARLLRGSAEDMVAFWRLFGLKPEHAAYLTKFNETRRMRRDPAKAALLPDLVREAVGLPLGEEAAYFVGGKGFFGQEQDDSVLDGGSPPNGQPSLWCHWLPNEDGTAIVWDEGEKFYGYIKWLEYLIAHFLAPWGYVLNGEMNWEGEASEDRGTIAVKFNQVLGTGPPGGGVRAEW